jgi:very-short-patch-repair endonuclease
MPERICSDGAIDFVLPPRAVADAARQLTSFCEVRALVADSVQQGRCRIDWLGEELAGGPVRSSAWLRRALAEVADGIRSAAEGNLRELLVRARLPMPMFNARLYAGQAFLAVADAWWADAGVAVEVDSREWHLSPEDWERTVRRSARMSAHGIIVLHVTPRQIRDHAAEVAASIGSAVSNGSARPRLAIRAIPAAG